MVLLPVHRHLLIIGGMIPAKLVEQLSELEVVYQSETD
jgi:hypothetical protein